MTRLPSTVLALPAVFMASLVQSVFGQCEPECGFGEVCTAWDDELRAQTTAHVQSKKGMHENVSGGWLRHACSPLQLDWTWKRWETPDGQSNRRWTCRGYGDFDEFQRDFPQYNLLGTCTGSECIFYPGQRDGPVVLTCSFPPSPPFPSLHGRPPFVVDATNVRCDIHCTRGAGRFYECQTIAYGCAIDAPPRLTNVSTTNLRGSSKPEPAASTRPVAAESEASVLQGKSSENPITCNTSGKLVEISSTSDGRKLGADGDTLLMGSGYSGWYLQDAYSGKVRIIHGKSGKHLGDKDGSLSLGRGDDSWYIKAYTGGSVAYIENARSGKKIGDGPSLGSGNSAWYIETYGSSHRDKRGVSACMFCPSIIQPPCEQGNWVSWVQVQCCPGLVKTRPPR